MNATASFLSLIVSTMTAQISTNPNGLILSEKQRKLEKNLTRSVFLLCLERGYELIIEFQQKFLISQRWMFHKSVQFDGQFIP